MRLGIVALACLAAGLSGCATVIEKPTQELKINVVGTGEALCDVTQEGRRYRAYAPGTIKVHKSRHPLSVRCFAPGNREKTIVLKSAITNTAFANVVTGAVPGMAVDAESGALFQYDKVVTFDFSDMPPRSYPVPDYQTVLDQNPQMIGLEEFRPGQAALIRDMGNPAPRLQPRAETTVSPAVQSLSATPVESESTGGAYAPAAVPADSGMMGADDLTRTMNPGVFRQ